VKAEVKVQGITQEAWNKNKATYVTLFKKTAAIIASGDVPGSVLPKNIKNVAFSPVTEKSSRRRLASESQVSFDITNPPTNNEDSAEVVDAASVKASFSGDSNTNAFADQLAQEAESLDQNDAASVAVVEQVSSLTVLGVSTPSGVAPNPSPSPPSPPSPPLPPNTPTPAPSAPQGAVPSPATKSKSNGSNAGVVAGSVVGALAAVALMAGLYYYATHMKGTESNESYLEAHGKQSRAAAIEMHGFGRNSATPTNALYGAGSQDIEITQNPLFNRNESRPRPSWG
jgi:hypothetical protein